MLATAEPRLATRLTSRSCMTDCPWQDGGSSRKETHLEKLHNKLPLAEAEARLARDSPREAVASVYYLAEVRLAQRLVFLQYSITARATAYANEPQQNQHLPSHIHEYIQKMCACGQGGLCYRATMSRTQIHKTATTPIVCRQLPHAGAAHSTAEPLPLPGNYRSYSRT